MSTNSLGVLGFLVGFLFEKAKHASPRTSYSFQPFLGVLALFFLFLERKKEEEKKEKEGKGSKTKKRLKIKKRIFFGIFP